MIYVHFTSLNSPWATKLHTLKLILLGLHSSLSLIYVHCIFIYLISAASNLKLNDLSINDCSRLQWLFHYFFLLTNFKHFWWNSIIFFPWSWSRYKFRWFFKSCWNPDLGFVFLLFCCGRIIVRFICPYSLELRHRGEAIVILPLCP